MLPGRVGASLGAVLVVSVPGDLAQGLGSGGADEPTAASTVTGVAIAIAHEQATRTVATAAVAFPPIRYVRTAATTTTGM